ncbi:UNKNOWN [Stylonychia lemnae]|uniref:Uncharacterized protein n=1 Tax=Stylonychia lemnae TaxID=5949 RepID=A0A078AJI2_STYLE|nr:UNKNOWN [Stylonychia lemnae]|eukprot:CDW82036.1 UNKNOWN [Stylonychia lemnae]
MQLKKLKDQAQAELLIQMREAQKYGIELVRQKYFRLRAQIRRIKDVLISREEKDKHINKIQNSIVEQVIQSYFEQEPIQTVNQKIKKRVDKIEAIKSKHQDLTKDEQLAQCRDQYDRLKQELLERNNEFIQQPKIFTIVHEFQEYKSQKQDRFDEQFRKEIFDIRNENQHEMLLLTEKNDALKEEIRLLNQRMTKILNRRAATEGMHQPHVKFSN